MQRYHRRHGSDGWYLQIDVKGYYPNMRHDVAEKVFRDSLPEWAAERAICIMREQYSGDVGYSPGSQMIQIAGISVLDGIDHAIKERLRVRHYMRYMDDMVLIHDDREFLERCKREIGDMLSSIGLSFNETKTRIRPLSDGIPYLGFVFYITESGKVLMRLKSASVKRMRRKIRKMARLVKNGKRSMAVVDESYKSWRNHASKGDNWKLIQRSDRWYREL